MHVIVFIRAQAEANAKKRQALRPDERVSFHSRASNFLERDGSNLNVSNLNDLLLSSTSSRKQKDSSA